MCSLAHDQASGANWYGRREAHEQEECQQRAAVIAEFDAGDTEATFACHGRFHCLPPDIAVPVGWTAFGKTRKSPGHSTGS
jgi:hypothetical protein